MSLPVLHLNYHEIRAEPWDYLYSLQLTDFEQHLETIGAEDLAARTRLGVTFDDGHRTQYEQAFPALQRAGRRAIFFITGSFTGTHADYMTGAQLRELADAGHEVQAHGWYHRFFTHCNDAQLDEELRRPKESVEQHTGREVDALSFPGGRWDKRVLAACRRAGYRRVFTSEPWPPEWEQGGLRLYSRFGIQRGLPATELQRIIRTGGRPSAKQRLVHAAKMNLRRAIGDERYHRLWCLLAHADPDAEQNYGGAER